MKNKLYFSLVFSIFFVIFSIYSCSEGGITAYNNPPGANIIAPTNESQFYQGEEINFKGHVSDREDDFEDLDVFWLEEDDILAETPADEEGYVYFKTSDLSEGEHRITLKTEDTSGLSAEAIVDITINSDYSPRIEIISPENDSEFRHTDTITFSAQISDEETVNLENLRVEWSSDLDGIFNTDPSDPEGSIEFSLPAGGFSLDTHTITLSVIDERNHGSSSSIIMTILECADFDEDGWTDCDGDCNDEDPSISPSRDEICDEIDNDCDEEIDEADAIDASIWYEDADEDGYGNSSATLRACEQPDGYVDNDDDCDDIDDNSYPGALEICDSADNDCDSYIDEGFDTDGDGYTSCSGDCDDTNSSINPAVAETCDDLDNDCDGDIDEGLTEYDYCGDIDEDGYGATGSGIITTCSTSVPDGYSALCNDCDDSNSSINPGVSEECDEIDNDCDGVADEGLTVYIYYGDLDEDGYGSSASGSLIVCETSPPEGYSYNSTDCDDSDVNVYPGAEEIFDEDGDGWYVGDGIDNDCDYTVDEGLGEEDCDDGDSSVYPGAEEIGYDNIDQDCDGSDIGYYFDWSYYQEIFIENSEPSSLTNYEISLEMDSSEAEFWSNVNSDGSDVRFTDEDYVTPLSYYIEEFNFSSQSSIIWISVPDIPASSTKLIYIYYGNPSATSESDINSVFEYGTFYHSSNCTTGGCEASLTYTVSSGDSLYSGGTLAGYLIFNIDEIIIYYGGDHDSSHEYTDLYINSSYVTYLKTSRGDWPCYEYAGGPYSYSYSSDSVTITTVGHSGASGCADYHYEWIYIMAYVRDGDPSREPYVYTGSVYTIIE